MEALWYSLNPVGSFDKQVFEQWQQLKSSIGEETNKEQ
jgi:hypothetical protein